MSRKCEVEVEISDELFAKLSEEAHRQGISPDELAGRIVNKKLAELRRKGVI